MILRRRCGLGEVLNLIPIITELRARKPKEEIFVETDYPEIFQGNPNVTGADYIVAGNPVVSLDNYVGEKEHIMDEYARAVFGDEWLGERSLKVYPSSKDREFANSFFKRKDKKLKGKIVTVGVLSDKQLALTVGSLRQAGLTDCLLFILGGPASKKITAGFAAAVYPRRGNGLSLGFLSLSCLIEKAVLHIGYDNTSLYAAMTTKIPIVALCGPAYMNSIFPFRRGIPLEVVSPKKANIETVTTAIKKAL